MTQYNETPVNCIFGAGAPFFSAPNGTEYVDTTSQTLYKRYGNAWHSFFGGGGSGLPYYMGPNGTYVVGQGSAGGYDFNIDGGANPGGQAGSVNLTSGAGTVDGNIIADARTGYITLRSQGTLSAPYQGAITLSAIYGAMWQSADAIHLSAVSGIFANLPTVAGASGSLVNTGGFVKVVP